MDLEVQVTPELSGRIGPGGTDAVLSVDGFGNRFALARKETAEQAVGVDPRGRYPLRVAPWLWLSSDDGNSWQHLDLLPRGADTLLPEGDLAVASSGTTTFVAVATSAGVVVTPITATRRGRVAATLPQVVPTPRLPGSSVTMAAHPGGAVLAVQSATGTSLYAVATAGAPVQLATLGSTTACDVAAGRRGGRPVAVLACLSGGTVTRSVVDLVTRVAATKALGSVDTRGGGTGAPSTGIAPDGTSYVLSGTRLWRTTSRGQVTQQDIRSEPGTYRVTSLSVSRFGRIGIAAYRKAEQGTFNVVVTVFTFGKKPIWSDFAYHDPVSPRSAAAPASERVAIDFDDRGRVQLVWTATLLHQEAVDAPLLRNVWSVRSNTT